MMSFNDSFQSSKLQDSFVESRFGDARNRLLLVVCMTWINEVVGAYRPWPGDSKLETDKNYADDLRELRDVVKSFQAQYRFGFVIIWPPELRPGGRFMFQPLTPNGGTDEGSVGLPDEFEIMRVGVEVTADNNIEAFRRARGGTYEFDAGTPPGTSPGGVSHLLLNRDTSSSMNEISLAPGFWDFVNWAGFQSGRPNFWNSSIQPNERWLHSLAFHLPQLLR